MKRRILFAVGLFALVACSLAPPLAVGRTPSAERQTLIQLPKIDRRPAAIASQRGKLKFLPTFNPNSKSILDLNLRSYDLTDLDLRDSREDLLHASFDSRTRWPPAERLPPAFDSSRILEIGKNPGLGLRNLHARGITGRGVGIAVIDQPLLVEHREYAENLQLYEEIGIPSTMTAQEHGTAVASIAVGKTLGVAPEAKLYYVAVSAANTTGRSQRDFHNYAQAVRRILELNRQLSEVDKIHAISLSVGWDPSEDGYAEITAAVQDARAAGLLVTSSNMEQTYGVGINGLGRVPLADPDRFESYEPGSFWARQFAERSSVGGILYIPMDSRAVASFTGKDEYAFIRAGGLSWITPYLAGVYALALQVDAKLTPERFLAMAQTTGRTIRLEQDGSYYPLGPIIDPVALIAAVGTR